MKCLLEVADYNADLNRAVLKEKYRSNIYLSAITYKKSQLYNLGF